MLLQLHYHNSGDPIPSDRGADREVLGSKPKFPWGVDPSYGSGSNRKNVRSQEIPATRDWVSDPSAWEDAERDHTFGVPIDFPYRYDADGNPILLVPNIEHGFQKQKYFRVEFEQTLTHLHHGPELGVKMPKNFDMNYYLSLDNPARINYAKKMVPRSTVITYQNEIAKKLIPVYNSKTKQYPGYAGTRRRETQLVVTPSPEPLSGTPAPINVEVENRDIHLGIIREDGLHITTFPITLEKLAEIANDDFWVLKEQDL